MPCARLVLAHVSLVLLALAQVGCLSHLRDELDSGGVCHLDSDCPSEDQCYCGGCVPRGSPQPLCDSDGDVPDGGGGDRDGGVPDAFVPPPDAGWCECPRLPPGCVYDGVPCGCSHATCTPQHCGRSVCAAGTECCNASCGICVAPGGGCVDLACAPDCTPQDAHSGGRCAGSVGWAWDGTACRAIACRCEGTECDSVFASEGECNAYFGACLPSDCHQDDAVGVGPCAAVIGYAFTSRGCFAISGCSCSGADCTTVRGRTEQQCNDAHASCPILFL